MIGASSLVRACKVGSEAINNVLLPIASAASLVKRLTNKNTTTAIKGTKTINFFISLYCYKCIKVKQINFICAPYLYPKKSMY